MNNTDLGNRLRGIGVSLLSAFITVMVCAFILHYTLEQVTFDLIFTLFLGLSVLLIIYFWRNDEN